MLAPARAPGDRRDPPPGRRGPSWPLSIAPMVDCSDRHFRFFVRQLTKHALQYTEMTAMRAILGDGRDGVLAYDPREKPLALQIAGDEPRQLARCAAIAEERGFDEVNLNVGCPSQRVQSGRFGACLMAQPALVAEIVAAMRDATQLPVSVKHRIGIDELDRYEDLEHFVRLVAASGCDRFIIHARIALLCGLSPKQNRTVPPLRFGDVYRLKSQHPHLVIEINGGLKTLESAREQLHHTDGCMLGRAAYDNPALLAKVDSAFYGATPRRFNRRDVIAAMTPYLRQWCALGHSAHSITRHMLGLFCGLAGAKKWRQLLSASDGRDSSTILDEALCQMPRESLDAPL